MQMLVAEQQELLAVTTSSWIFVELPTCNCSTVDQGQATSRSFSHGIYRGMEMMIE